MTPVTRFIMMYVVVDFLMFMILYRPDREVKEEPQTFWQGFYKEFYTTNLCRRLYEWFFIVNR